MFSQVQKNILPNRCQILFLLVKKSLKIPVSEWRLNRENVGGELFGICVRRLNLKRTDKQVHTLPVPFESHVPVRQM